MTADEQAATEPGKNWSYLVHRVGDMIDREEYQPVRGMLPDGRLVRVDAVCNDEAGRLCLVLVYE